ncbi:MAG: putative protein kinase [Streblomastix strix]|uniref:non-specific serine/threonine protein kinase n=1 Tax=Streblomastix strix TaxID=222440 RepID=A0A5J4WX21_9EUKA|nr:MAG: putative protein kinase [Streblomastix strix]
MPHHTYRKQKEIYKGQESTITVVEHKESKVNYIWKRILKGKIEAFKRIEKEIVALTRINSPYVIKFFEQFEYQGYFYIVTEYCSGGTLKNFINEQLDDKQEISEIDAISILAQLALGLQDVHSSHILHLNLTTSNILITEDGHLKICDFGDFEEIKDNLIHPINNVDNEYYSPEICNQKFCSIASDIWSLGICIYEVITGHLPFRSSSNTDLHRMIRKDSPPPIQNQNISEGFQQLVLRMLSKNPSERPSLDEILKHRIIQPFVSGISQRKISISKIKEKKKEKEKTKEKDKEKKKEMEKDKEIIEQKGFDKEKKVEQERDGEVIMEDASEDDICIDSQAYYIPSTRNVRVSENILYAKREEDSTVAVGPPIRRGIWHIRLTFANSGFTRGFGAMSTPISIPPSFFPGKSSNIATFHGLMGIVYHGKTTIKGQNDEWNDGDEVGAELNMESQPRTLHFFIGDKQQRVFISNLPQEMRFFIYLRMEGTSVEIRVMMPVTVPTAAHAENGIEISWQSPEN